MIEPLFRHRQRRQNRFVLTRRRSVRGRLQGPIIVACAGIIAEIGPWRTREQGS